MVEAVALVPLFPLLGVFANLLMGRRLSKSAAGILACGALGASFLASAVAVFGLAVAGHGARSYTVTLYEWIGSGSFTLDIGFLLDPLSSVMILVVTGVGALIHIYSIGYMDEDHRDDKGFQRFFCYLNLFTFSMLVLVLADNLVLMFLGWEGVGL
ncbi:NADH-quinone oxidoreductase subunit L, partial [bacterium]|nr:NADH-quinone oxidoreductase subunit L [bacterium]